MNRHWGNLVANICLCSTLMFQSRRMRWFALFSLLLVPLIMPACGSGANSADAGGPLSGNWEMTLLRTGNPAPETYSGFLLQSGDSLSGAFILGDNCSGVGPVSGSVNGQNFQLDVNEFGQDLSLTGTLPPGGPSSSTFLSGAFSSLAGGCVTHPSTGTWSAVQVQPIAGSFHGTLVLQPSQTLNVTGTLTQGPNAGSSNASLNGSITASGGTPFCAYLTTATITGLISGTGVSLNLFGPDGSQIGTIGSGEALASVTANGASLSGNASLSQISKSCPEQSGSFQITFP